MMSNSFDVYETVIFPILGGVIAGFVVIVIELVFRNLYDRWQRRKTIKAIEKLLSEWESKINNPSAIENNPAGTSPSKGEFQLPIHRYHLKITPITIAAWSKQLSEGEAIEIHELIAGQENVAEFLFSQGFYPDQNYYDNFFSKVREIKWLKF